MNCEVWTMPTSLIRQLGLIPFINVVSNYYWSSSSVAYVSGNAWGVYGDGDVYGSGKDGNYYVWPVRSGQ